MNSLNSNRDLSFFVYLFYIRLAFKSKLFSKGILKIKNHHHAGLYRIPKKRDKSDPYRNGEIKSRPVKSDNSPDKPKRNGKRYDRNQSGIAIRNKE